MAEFDINREIARYAARICLDIRNAQVRQSVTNEYIQHMEDATELFMRQGMTPEAAFDEACRDLGDLYELQTMLAITHNKDGLPPWVVQMGGVLLTISAVIGYLTVRHDSAKAWLGFLLSIEAGVVILLLLWQGYLWLRAAIKRKDARKRLKRYARENGMTLTEHTNAIFSLFKRQEVPEWVLDAEGTRYIISLFPTIKRRHVLHLHENGLYRYAKKFGFMLVTRPQLWLRTALFYSLHRFNLGGFPLIHSTSVELPRGIYRIPKTDYDTYHSHGKQNIHILLLSPIPLDVDLCEGGRIRKIADGEKLPDTYGSAYVYSASGFLGALSHGGVRHGKI